MQIKKYMFRMMMGVMVLILGLTVLLMTLLIDRRFNTYLYESHQSQVDTIKTQVIAILDKPQAEDVKSKLNTLEKFAMGSGYTLQVHDAKGSPLLVSGKLRMATHMNGRWAETHKEKHQLILDNGDVVSLLLQYKGDFNASSSAILFKNMLYGISTLVAVLSGIVVFFVSRLMATKFSKPIETSTNHAHQITSGVYDQVAYQGTGIIELDDLGVSLNTMSESINIQEELRVRLVEQMGHEIKTPLSIIQTQLEGAQKGILSLDQETLDLLYHEVQELTTLVESLESTQELASRFNAVKTARCDLGDLIHHLKSRITYAYEKRGLLLDLTMGEDLVIETDATKLNHILMNLLMNAHKYAKEHTRVLLNVQVSEDVMYITLQNTLPQPIDLDVSELGTFGYRGDKLTVEGKGVGLFIVKRLITQLAGTIDFDISPSTFEVKLQIPHK